MSGGKGEEEEHEGSDELSNHGNKMVAQSRGKSVHNGYLPCLVKLRVCLGIVLLAAGQGDILRGFVDIHDDGRMIGDVDTRRLIRIPRILGCRLMGK